MLFQYLVDAQATGTLQKQVSHKWDKVWEDEIN